MAEHKITGDQIVYLDEQGKEIRREPDTFHDSAAITVEAGYKHLAERDEFDDRQHRIRYFQRVPTPKD